MYVDIEKRTDGPAVRVWVKTSNPRTAIRKALEQTPGPGIATIQGHPDLVGRAFANGIITITVNKKRSSK